MNDPPNRDLQRLQHLIVRETLNCSNRSETVQQLLNWIDGVASPEDVAGKCDGDNPGCVTLGNEKRCKHDQNGYGESDNYEIVGKKHRRMSSFRLFISAFTPSCPSFSAMDVMLSWPH